MSVARRIATGVTLAAALSGWPPPSHGAGPAAQPQTLSVVCSRSLLHAINDSDAIAAAKSWIDLMARRRNLNVVTAVALAETPAQLRQMVQDGGAHLLVLGGLEYLALESLNLVEPIGTFESARGGGSVRYILLSPPGSGLSRLEDLAGQRVHFGSRAASNLGRLWVESHLREARPGGAGQLFAEAKNFPKASAACLPVFFGSVPACVVEWGEWDLLTEMNPQLKTRLRQVALSPPVLDTVICVRIGPVPHRAELIETLLTMDRDPQGKQILMLFKTQRIAPFEPKGLEALRGWSAKRPETRGPSGEENARPPRPSGSKP